MTAAAPSPTRNRSGEKTADVLQFRSISDDLEVRQNFRCPIAARANLRRGNARFPDDPDPAIRLARRPPSGHATQWQSAIPG